MKNGFLKVALSKLSLIIADPLANVKTIIKKINYLKNENVKIFLTPELSLISNSCNDLLFNHDLLNNIEKAIKILMNYTKHIDMLIILGTALLNKTSLLNVSIVLYKGEILGIIPKTNISTENMKYYYNGSDLNDVICLFNTEYKLKKQLIIKDNNFFGLNIGLILGDLFEQYYDLDILVNNGVNIILNPCNYIIKNNIDSQYLANKLSLISSETNTVILTASNGYGEDNSKKIFSGYNGIFECGKILGQNDIFTPNDDIITEIDFNKCQLLSLKKNKLKHNNQLLNNIKNINFKFKENLLTRKFSMDPFLESLDLNNNNNDDKLKKIFNMQVFALKNKIISAKTNGIVIAFSGGMDSTLALIIAYQCCVNLNIKLLSLVMPGFGTSNNSLNNSKQILNLLKINYKTISIIDSVKQHFHDINHSVNIKNNVYENAQARERTQIALDIANNLNFLFIGSSNLSEIALGWTTFAGDNISHYSINSGIPKSIIKKLLLYVSYNIPKYFKIKNIIKNILNSPISPELLPNQNTEKIIGPYELHDYFLFYFLNNNFKIKKIYNMACYTFKNKYTCHEIKQCLKIFINRFFSQQFKRNSCNIEGLKIFDVSLNSEFVLSSNLDLNYLTKKL